MKNNMIGWFEIPVSDMDRAVKFYETVFGITMERHRMGETDMAWFPFVDDGLGAPVSLVQHKDYYKPSSNGVLVYFTAHSGNLSNELAKVEQAGGKWHNPKLSSPKKSVIWPFLSILKETG